MALNSLRRLASRARVASNSGMATLVALIMVGMLTLIGLAALSTSDDEVSIAGNELHDRKAFYAAEAGLEIAVAQIQAEYEATGLPPVSAPEGAEDLNDCSVEYRTTDDGTEQARLSDGNLAGLHALVKTYTIRSTAISSLDGAREDLVQEFEAAQIPIFQFAVFYNDDFQTTPMYDMIINGRVHVNGSMYIQALTNLSFDSWVSASGSIYHGLKYGNFSGSAGGNIFIKDRVGLYQNMKTGSGWLDARNADWHSLAQSRWGGRVQDQAFGQEELRLPLTNSGDMRKLIERETGNSDSFERKATLKFINGQAYKLSGSTWTDVTADMTTKGIITQSSDKFYDKREGKNVDVTDLDIGALYANGYGPANGVIYFSDSLTSTKWPALRLKNATTLGAALTVASDNPVYTLGNFNTNSKKPAAIIADAYTILSSNWDDTKGALSTSSRTAVATTVNVCMITGDTRPTSSNYGGGLENLPRFLEYWGGTRTATIRGSMINLWESEQADGDWSLDYYEPPRRDWAYDTELNDPSKQPPQSPCILVFRRIGWKQENIAFRAESMN